MKAFFPFQVLGDHYPEVHLHGAVPVRLCLHFSKVNRMMKNGSLFLGGGLGKVVWRGIWTIPNSFLGQPAMKDQVWFWRCCLSSRSFSCTPTLYPFPKLFELVLPASILPSLLPTLSTTEMQYWQIFIRSPIPARARRLLCFISPSKHWTRMRDLYVRFLLLMQTWCICGCDNPFLLYECWSGR